MSKAKIDAYIAGKPDWSRPLLTKARRAILKANPKIVEEWKWRAPAFTHHGIVCLLWGFKAHISITFHNGVLLADKTDLFDPADQKNEHNRAIRIARGEKIPAGEITRLVKLACQKNEQGIAPAKPKAAKKKAVVSADFSQELKKNKKAGKFFDSLAPSYKRLYTDWISSAKREETRKNRINRALERLAGGHKQPYC